MNATTIDITNAICAKTDLGRSEIQSRALRLPPLTRRLLLLVDGQRRTSELAAFVPGQDAEQLMRELIANGCVEVLAGSPAKAAAAQVAAVDVVLPGPATVASLDPDLADLPDASERHANEIEMARNFMTNTINTMHGQNTRLTLIRHIHECENAQQLRAIYPEWRACMNDSRAGAKRLPELRAKLLDVL